MSGMLSRGERWEVLKQIRAGEVNIMDDVLWHPGRLAIQATAGC